MCDIQSFDSDVSNKREKEIIVSKEGGFFGARIILYETGPCLQR